MKPAYWGTLIGMVLTFSALTGYTMWHQSPADFHDNHNVAATLLTISGPFTGAIARSSQHDCWRFSWKLVPYCAPVLIVAVIFQFCPLPFKRGQESVRIAVWTIGWLVWFGGAIMSLMYALS